eukprot:2705717-Prymnesium_polylepis.1
MAGQMGGQMDVRLGSDGVTLTDGLVHVRVLARGRQRPHRGANTHTHTHTPAYRPARGRRELACNTSPQLGSPSRGGSTPSAGWESQRRLGVPAQVGSRGAGWESQRKLRGRQLCVAVLVEEDELPNGDAVRRRDRLDGFVTTLPY